MHAAFQLRCTQIIQFVPEVPSRGTDSVLSAQLILIFLDDRAIRISWKCTVVRFHER